MLFLGPCPLWELQRGGRWHAAGPSHPSAVSLPVAIAPSPHTPQRRASLMRRPSNKRTTLVGQPNPCQSLQMLWWSEAEAWVARPFTTCVKWAWPMRFCWRETDWLLEPPGTRQVFRKDEMILKVELDCPLFSLWKELLYIYFCQGKTKTALCSEGTEKLWIRIYILQYVQP